MTDRLDFVRQAAELLGGQRELGRELDVSDRFVRYLLAGDRDATDGMLADIVDALDRRAMKCTTAAAEIRKHVAKRKDKADG